MARTYSILLFIGCLATIGADAFAQRSIACDQPYTIRPGDTLRSIAIRAYGSDDFQQLWNDNRATIGNDPNRIEVGDRLQLRCPAGERRTGSATETPAAVNGANFEPAPDIDATKRKAANADQPKVEIVFNKASAPKFIINVGIIDPLFADAHANRIHGDCHMGNVLWRGDTPHFVDFDDCVMGPPVQDLWMLLSGERADQTAQLTLILDAYTTFTDFSVGSLRLIEPLRTLRIMHHAAWIARRWHDPAFPLAFPWFDSPRFWSEHLLELREQQALLDELTKDAETMADIDLDAAAARVEECLPILPS